MESYDHLFKILLIGNSGCGKSQILLRYADEIFSDAFITTIGVDFKIKTLSADGSQVKLQIWDTAGQERFRTITSSYYRGAHGIIVTFDKTDRESFDAVESWIEAVKRHANEGVVLFLVANKCDLPGVISSEEGQEKALRNEMTYAEVSAKTGEQVERVFETIARTLIEKEKFRSANIAPKDKVESPQSDIHLVNIDQKDRVESSPSDNPSTNIVHKDFVEPSQSDHPSTNIAQTVKTHSQEYDFLFKLILIGSSGCGKSQILLRFADNSFSDIFISTIGVDFKNRTLSVEGYEVKLQIWDTAGQERFKTITSSYYRGAHGIIVTFDKTDRESFDAVESWIEEAKRHAVQEAVLFLVANKCDLPSVVSSEEGQEKALRNGMAYAEISAKTGEQVGNVFQTLARVLIVKAREGSI